MIPRTHAGERDSASESKFYLPVGFTPRVGIDRVERLWATLFSHRVDPPK